MSEWLNYLFNVIGFLGMACILLAYAMQQFGWKATEAKYLLTNIIGALGLIISLLWNWNMPSFVLECIWLGVSCFGLWRWWRRHQEGTSLP